MNGTLKASTQTIDKALQPVAQVFQRFAQLTIGKETRPIQQKASSVKDAFCIKTKREFKIQFYNLI